MTQTPMDTPADEFRGAVREAVAVANYADDVDATRHALELACKLLGVDPDHPV